MVRYTVDKLNMGKCDTLPSLFLNSFKNGPSHLYDVLSKLFSTMLTHGFTCDIFNLIKFSPLVENKRKCIED